MMAGMSGPARFMNISSVNSWGPEDKLKWKCFKEFHKHLKQVMMICDRIGKMWVIHTSDFAHHKIWKGQYTDLKFAGMIEE